MSWRKTYSRDYSRIGDKGQEQPLLEEFKKDSTWTCVGIAVGAFAGCLFLIAIILSATFSGIAAFRDLSVTVNSTAPLSNEEQQLKFDVASSVNDVINSLTDRGTCTNLCANGCFTKFFICPSDSSPSECERRSLILKDCNDFINCLGECNLSFDKCAMNMDDTQDFSGKCINRYNREMICPR